jgi:hypothetical protein
LGFSFQAPGVERAKFARPQSAGRMADSDTLLGLTDLQYFGG